MNRNQLLYTGVKQKLQMIKSETNYRDRRSVTDSIKDQYTANYGIRQPQVRLIDANGNNLGVVNTREALSMAQADVLDLVLVNTAANPPVAKICDYNKFIYEAKLHKKEQDRKTRENAIHV